MVGWGLSITFFTLKHDALMWKKGNILKKKNVMHSYMEKCNALMWKNIMYSCDRPLNTVKSLFSIIVLRELF